MEKTKLIITISGIVIFLFYGLYSYISGVTDYIADSFIFAVILVILFAISKKINISSTGLILIIISSILHLSGVFGWYNKSPFPMQYDHLTHLVGLFAISVTLYQAFEKNFTKSRFHNFSLLLIILFSSLGIGAFIEQTEYLGYLRFGTGAGLLRFGGLGDTTVNEENLRAMDIIGGGWVNTMLDLNYNFIGAISGIILMRLINKFKLKK